MADPLSITGGVLAVISASTSAIKAISKFVRDVREARDDLANIRKELTDLQFLLEEINQEVDSSGQEALPETLTRQIRGMLKGCDSVVIHIQEVLVKYRRDNLATKGQWVLSGGRETIDRLKSSLESHKTGLSIAFDMIVLSVTRSIKEDTSAIKTDTVMIIDGMDAMGLDITAIRAIVNRLEHLQATSGQSKAGDRDLLQRYLEELTTYAGSLYEGSIADPDDLQSVTGSDDTQTIQGSTYDPSDTDSSVDSTQPRSLPTSAVTDEVVITPPMVSPPTASGTYMPPYSSNESDEELRTMSSARAERNVTEPSEQQDSPGSTLSTRSSTPTELEDVSSDESGSESIESEGPKSLSTIDAVPSKPRLRPRAAPMSYEEFCREFCQPSIRTFHDNGMPPPEEPRRHDLLYDAYSKLRWLDCELQDIDESTRVDRTLALLRAGADPHMTVLHYDGSPKLTSVLPDKLFRSPIQNAIVAGNIACFHVLLDREPHPPVMSASVHSGVSEASIGTDSEWIGADCPLLHFAVIWAQDRSYPGTEIMTSLIEAGCDVNHYHNSYGTPLIAALQACRDATNCRIIRYSVEELLKHGAIPNVIMGKHAVTRNRRLYRLPLILAMGYKHRNVYTDMPLDSHQLRGLVLHPSSSGVGISDRSSLLRMLIDYGADVNFTDLDSEIAPLTFAIRRYEHEAIQILLDNGANHRLTQWVNGSAQSPMRAAAEALDIRAIRLLLRKPADDLLTLVTEDDRASGFPIHMAIKAAATICIGPPGVWESADIPKLLRYLHKVFKLLTRTQTGTLHDTSAWCNYREEIAIDGGILSKSVTQEVSPRQLATKIVLRGALSRRWLVSEFSA